MATPLNESTTHDIIFELLNEVARELAAFLEKKLPLLFDEWWDQAVVKSLSFHQCQRIKQQQINSLAALDLAALLRVLDQNWFQISSHTGFLPESRHFVKEMQTVRNRWAHVGAKGLSWDDVYRDLDTLQRFAELVCCTHTLIQKIRERKSQMLDTPLSASKHASPLLNQPSASSENDATEFRPGQMVVLRSNPDLRGVIIACIPGEPENRFQVFINNAPQIFYASQLRLEEPVDDEMMLSSEQFHAYLSALQIRFPSLSTLYSLHTARVDFIPYQFRPVLRFIRSDRPRLLIADAVGVGKTIEAGFILRELQARRDIRSVLIICPRPLVTEQKWVNEMKRFDERFVNLDGNTLRYCLKEMDTQGAWPEQLNKVVVPYSLFDEVLLYGSRGESRRKRHAGLLDLDPPPRFDLVIVDEAHHIRNPETYSHKAVRFFCDHAEAVLFLTATPVQLGSRDLFVLLNILRPDLILDEESFNHMAAPNPHINRAASLLRSQEKDWELQAVKALDQAAVTPWGKAILQYNPSFIRVRSRLQEGRITNEERVQLINEIEGLHTFANIINRTRRRDIGDFTIRKPETVSVPFTPQQQELHDLILRVQAEIFGQLHGDANVGFMMTTIRRQAASCLFGLTPFLETILNRRIDELEWEETDDCAPVVQPINAPDIRTRIKRILERAKSLPPEDPKLNILIKILRDKQKLPNNKVMLFSSFRHTLQYLHRNLIQQGFRVGMVHGGTPDEDRIKLRERFEKDRENSQSLDILLFSEVGCEGLDYQFCDCIVNYDLPWNPMRVEQRIGRIDRNGQKSESIAIINLITPGTVDADIYERCLMRIGVFNSSLGGNEEILGEISKGIRDIAENFNLSEEDRRKKLQQLADNKIRLIKEQEELEQKQVELFGIRLPEILLKQEIEDATSFWLSPPSIKRLVTQYLQKVCGRDQEFILGEKPLKTLRLSQEARAALLRDYQQLPRQNNVTYRAWENWLKGGDPLLPVTFEAECAKANPQATFITPLHPLVKQAALSIEARGRAIVSLRANSDCVPAGVYDFAIYQWHFHGLRDSLVLQPIGASPEIDAHLIHLLERAGDASPKKEHKSDQTRWNELDKRHYALWSEEKEKHQRKTREHVEFRRESLTKSHQARIALLQEQLENTDNEKIRRMRESQIAAAEADYARRIQELDIAVEKADITAQPVAYGTIEIMGGNTE